MNKLLQFFWFLIGLIIWTLLLWAERFFGWPLLSFIFVLWLFDRQWPNYLRPIGYIFVVFLTALSFNLTFFVVSLLIGAMFVVVEVFLGARRLLKIGLLAELKRIRLILPSLMGSVVIGFLSGINGYQYWLWWVLVLVVITLWFGFKSTQNKLSIIK